MIVVFDSNTWVSALQFGGKPLAALHKAYIHDRIAYCDEIRAEVQMTPIRKFGWNLDTVALMMRLPLEGALFTQSAGDFRGICRDPDDDRILECAVLADARVIVTGDKDLLTLRSFAAIDIITPRAYLEIRR